MWARRWLAPRRGDVIAGLCGLAASRRGATAPFPVVGGDALAGIGAVRRGEQRQPEFIALYVEPLTTRVPPLPIPTAQSTDRTWESV